MPLHLQVASLPLAMQLTMDAGRSDDGVSSLKDSLARNNTILSGNCSDGARHRACDDLLNSFASSLQALDGREGQLERSVLVFYEQAWMAVFVQSGLFSGSQLRHILLRILQNASRKSAIRQFVLDRLSTVMPGHMDPSRERIASQVVQILWRIVQEQPDSLIHILNTLTRLPLSDKNRVQVIDMALQKLPSASEATLVAIIHNLLYLVGKAEQIGLIWPALRRKMQVFQETTLISDHCDLLTRIMHELCSTFRGAYTHPWLLQSYVNHVHSSSEQLEVITLMDIILLVVIGANERTIYADSVDHILYTWLKNDSFPFDALRNCLQLLAGDLTDKPSEGLSGSAVDPTEETTAVIRQGFSQLLMRRLLTFIVDFAHDGGTVSDEMLRLFTAAYALLDCDERTHTMQLLLTMLDSALYEGASNDKAASLVQGSVYELLDATVGYATDEMYSLQTMLIDRLLSSTDDCLQLCRVLVRNLMPGDDNNSSSSSRQTANANLIMLLQRLLTFTSIHVHGPSTAPLTETETETLTIHGVALATEMIQSATGFMRLAEMDRARIRDWILAILLPTTRYSVSPKLGSACLKFVRYWLAIYPASKPSIYQTLKAILAHTGLVQRPDQDRQSNLVAFACVPEQFTSETVRRKPMQFCVAYYMRRAPVNEVAKWKGTIFWIFDLLDMYLELGRESVVKGWRFESWLLADIDIPNLELPAGLVDFDRGQLQFSRRSDRQSVNNTGDVATTKALLEDVDSVLVVSVQQYTLSLWVAVALISAVVKNAFEHGSDSQRVRATDRPRSLQQLLQLQFWKLFDLRRRLHVCLKLVRSLGTLLCGGPSKKETLGLRKRGRSPPSHENLVLVASIESLGRCLIDLDTTVYLGSVFFQPEVLWECLFDLGDEEVEVLLKSIPEYMDSQIGEPNILLISLKAAQAYHLLAWLENNSGYQVAQTPYRLAQCLRLCRSLVPTLPSLRVKASVSCVEETVTIVSQIMSLTLAYLRLLLLLLVQAVATSHESRNDEIMLSSFDWIKYADNGHAAACILDILTMVAVRQREKFVDEVIESSWICIHTIYTGDACQDSISMVPFVLTFFRERRYFWSDSQGKRLVVVLHEYLSKLAGNDQSFMAGAKRLIQHFGLLLAVDSIPQYFDHLLFVVTDVLRCAKSLRIHSGYRNDGTKDADREYKSQSPPPVLPFLAHGTCATVLMVAIHLTIWPLTFMDPGVMPEAGPYRHYMILASWYQRLVSVVCESYYAFPRRLSNDVIDAAHRAILAGTSVMYRCIEWRRVQSVKGIDIGTLAQLKELQNTVASDILGSVFVLCDFFQTLESRALVGRSSGLRQAANKAGRTLNGLAAMHNWPPPTYELRESAPLLYKKESLPAKGYHEYIELSEVLLAARDAGAADLHMDSESSDGSFGVAGDWGDSDSD